MTLQIFPNPAVMPAALAGDAVVAARTLRTIGGLTARTLAHALKTEGMRVKVIQPCA